MSIASEGTPTVAAVLLPTERARVEAAGQGCFRVLCRETVSETISAVRERPVNAVLVSVHRCDPTASVAVGRLVASFPALPAVALVSRHDPEALAALLRLGALGIRDVVDVTQPAGWGRLRHLVSEPTTSHAARILGPLLDRLPELHREGRDFVDAIVRVAPTTPTVRGLARTFGVCPSTLMSRFTRAGLPSAKRYLASIRILHAAQLMENRGLTIADVAYRLECSSPQSFGRHIRTVLGITCSEFRGRFPFPASLDRFLKLMIEPYQREWQQFRPAGYRRPQGSGGSGLNGRATDAEFGSSCK